jgi:hypothetical protein
MTHVRVWAHGFACVVVWLGSGCGRDAIGGSAHCDGLLPGDVVITEVHANPDGADADGEYVELFNASGQELSLDGLALAASRLDGASPKSHRFLAGSIEDEAYFVVGNAAPSSARAHVDYSYEQALGSLRNSDGIVSIRCDEMLIDEVRYEATSDGRALELDGQLVPDHELNDDARHWCITPVGAAPSFDGNFGTPGARNNRCERVEIEDGLCVDDGASRPVRAPRAGAVHISEWMANPEGPDSTLEWVEVRFDEAADLHQFELGPSLDAVDTVVDSGGCAPVGAGAHVVFGASPAAAPRVDAALRFSLGNSGPKSIVASSDGVVLDRVDYDGTASGVAWQVDSDEQVCLAESVGEYAPGNLGTPGDPNPSCPVVVAPGTCVDAGGTRDIVSPAFGEARISEWMANPSAVGNREGEWVELRFESRVDLNGLALSDLVSSMTLEGEECLTVAPGSHVLFARNIDVSQNGGIDDADFELSLSLNNTDEELTLSVGDTVLDAVTYGRATPGVAIQVDELGNVCDAVQAYGDGDLGTPGGANPVCA